MVTSEKIEEFVKQARRIGKERLQLCSSGNLSWRVSDNVALVSGTGTWLSRLEGNDIAVCEIESAVHVGGCTPSMESSSHLGIMQQRSDVNVVLHCQSEFATLVSCLKYKPANFNVTAEIPCYCGREIPVIPYFGPGSPELADAVAESFMHHDVAILSKQGQVVCGKDFDDVLQKAVFLEMACRIIVRAGTGNYQTLSEEEIDALEIYISGKTGL